MKKHQLLELRTETTMPTKDGRLLTKIRQQPRLRDLIRTSDSNSIDHSTSFQDCHPTEPLSTNRTTTQESRCGKWAENNNNGCLVKTKPSGQFSARHELLASCTVVDTTVLSLRMPIQDGGRCSDTRMVISSTKRARS